MRNPSLRLTFLIMLLVIILTQEGIILFNMSTFGQTRQIPWHEQWPFSSDNSGKHAKTTEDFAYNGSHVELVIGLKEEESYEGLVATITQEKGQIINKISLHGKTRSITANIPTDKASSILEKIVSNEVVQYVEPNWKFSIDATPNDPGWINQWGPTKIQANIAWNLQKGNSSILVAVVDTGIYYTHPDLTANYAPLGYDWVNNDADPMDDHGHGTHCAGIIAATLNNSKGIAGIAQVRVMAEKGLDQRGQGYDDDLANAIIHAAEHGAKIISCSWGSDSESQTIHDAIKYATNLGALVIAAAGNSGTNIRHYPASYEEVIAVTATDEGDDPADFTTYGDWIDIAAPGTSIYSTYLWNTYFSLSGTSMACPHVAGVAALVWSQYPAMTNEQVRSQLLYTADDKGATGFDIYYGWGRVNARKAVTQTIALIGSKVLKAPANAVYFLYRNPNEGIDAATAYDTIANGIIYGLTTNLQKQSFTTTNQLLLGTGELNTSTITNAAVVIFGGPCPQKTVEYYENAGLAPLKFAANTTKYKFTTQNGQTVAELSRTLAKSGHEDMFVIEVLMDKGNLIVIMYGFTWKGTWAAGIYFKEVISKNFNAYSEKCYVFHWIDNAQDGIPDSTEIYQQY